MTPCARLDWMLRFLSVTVAYSVLMLGLGAPLFVAARREGRSRLIRQFVIGAVVVGAFCGVLAASSAKLVSDCEKAGNPDCVDYGSTGMQLFGVVAYTLTAWIKAYRLRYG